MLKNDTLSDFRNNLGQIRVGYSISLSFLMFVYVFSAPTDVMNVSHACLRVL